MTLLLDANVLLPAVLTPDLLPPSIQALLLDIRNEPFVSHATLWEMLSKVHRGQIMVKGKAASVTIDHVRKLGAEFLPILEKDILTAVTLPDIHRDPFNRMLVAQAQRLNATIVSSDRKLHLYGVPVMAL